MRNIFSLLTDSAIIFSVSTFTDEITRPRIASKRALSTIATRGAQAMPPPGYSVDRERKAQSHSVPSTAFRASQGKSEKSPRAYNYNHNPLNTLNITAKENLSEIPAGHYLS